MLTKITKIILLIAGYLLTLSITARIIDNDLGWHLRFGMDVFAGKFPYADTYTWTYFGQTWINHEWGSDIFFWLIYANLGYFALAAVIAALIWSSFLLMLKIFTGKLSIISILLSAFGVWALDFIFVVRPAFLALILLPWLLYTLTALPKKNLLFLWPFIFWLWSALHGSWLISFIVVFIYAGGNLIFFILKKYLPRFSGKETGWSARTIIKALFWLAISAIAILANPYGAKIYEEISAYLIQGAYFKTIINEWIPSYTYPVYILPLIIGSVAAVFAVVGYLKKRLSLPELLIFFAFFFAAWNYKRNNLYLVIFSLPILSTVLAEAGMKIASFVKYQKINLNKAWLGISTALGIALIIFSARGVYISSDIWNDAEFLARRPYPYYATQFLKHEAIKNQIFLFNEFRWGGFLNWMLPEAYVYIDGRGTVTWHDHEGANLLQKYRQIKFEINGLEILNSTRANYAIISQNINSYPTPNLANKIIFPAEQLKQLATMEESQLEKMLARSPKWQLVYEDKICRVWKRK